VLFTLIVVVLLRAPPDFSLTRVVMCLIGHARLATLTNKLLAAV
jgi:hypothetical protein